MVSAAFMGSLGLAANWPLMRTNPARMDRFAFSRLSHIPRSIIS